jgi:hypothetical protein
VVTCGVSGFSLVETRPRVPIRITEFSKSE